MAGWLKPLALALLAALLAHALALWLIGSQMPQAGSILDQRSDPLFTRTISAASTPDAAAPKPAAQAAAPSAAGPGVITPSRPKKTTPTLPTPIPSPSSEPLKPLSTVASTTTSVALAVTTSATPPAPTPTTPSLESTATAASPTAVASSTPQTMTAQPSGSTDSLLAVGEWPADTRVNYLVGGYFQGRELGGQGQVQWTRSGAERQDYQVRVQVKAHGVAELRFTSQGRLTAQGLQPQVFEEFLNPAVGSKRTRPLRLEANELVLENGKRIARPAQEPMAVQDTVSQFIDLGHRFSMGRSKLEEGQVTRVWLGRPGGLDEWVYDIGPAETLQLPRIGAVKVHALKPRPIANPRGPITMELWLAPSLQYLPAKIRINIDAQTYIELSAQQIQQN